MKKFNWFGFFIIIAGVLLLLDAFDVMGGLLAERSVWTLIWPSAILWVGISSIAGARRITLWGTVISLIGIYFLLSNLGVIGRLPDGVLFPVIVIAIGLAIFLPGHITFKVKGNIHSEVGTESDEDGYINSTAVFGGDERVISGEVFKGAKITTTFGGAELDLSGFSSCLPRTVIDVTCAFGGVDLVVPPNARVERGGLTCAFGGMEITGPVPQNAEFVIVLNGLVAFGGLDVKYPVVIRESK